MHFLSLFLSSHPLLTAEYAAQPPDEPMPCEPRLFWCSDKFGSFAVEEIASFSQVRLRPLRRCNY